MDAAGVDGEWARWLPERLEASAWPASRRRARRPALQRRRRPARFWSLTWLQVRDGIVATGVPGAVVDAGRAALEDPARWFHGPAKVVAWGRRPGPAGG